MLAEKNKKTGAEVDRVFKARKQKEEGWCLPVSAFIYYPPPTTHPTHPLSPPPPLLPPLT